MMLPVNSKDSLFSDNSLNKINSESRSRKQSTTTGSMISKTRFSVSGEERSWWYILCQKCWTRDDDIPSWAPTCWPKLCPRPYCPTYRQFSRIVCIILIGLIGWVLLYAFVGSPAAPPHGLLFQLILLSICAHFGGWLVSLTTLPALLGMLAVGMLLQNTKIVNIDDSFNDLNRHLRHVALVIILTKAGLDLDPKVLRKNWFTVIKLGILPWIFEAGSAAVLSHFLLGLPWSYGFLLGSAMAAVSPAVVIACLFRLRSKGYGVAKGIPTLIIAVSGVDDAASAAVFGIIKSIMFSHKTVAELVVEGPVSILGGIVFGILWGVLNKVLPERNDPFLVPLRILLLLSGGFLSYFGAELIGFDPAGPLGCVISAFVALIFWTKQGWEIEENPVATAYDIFWMIFEPVLFGLTGASIKFEHLNGDVVFVSMGVVVSCVLLRMMVTTLLGIGSRLNLKEKLFVSIAWMAKAAVQAALAPIALAQIKTGTKEHEYAQKLFTTLLVSILLTAPTGAILITILGSKLLTKTKYTVTPKDWRRSHRPSIRDISIIDEEEERTEDFDSRSDISTIKTPESYAKNDV